MTESVGCMGCCHGVFIGLIYGLIAYSERHPWRFGPFALYAFSGAVGYLLAAYWTRDLIVRPCRVTDRITMT